MPLDEIVVDESVSEFARMMGNLDVLQSSIEKVGLINPVMIDENNNLIAGYRRLSACKKLGWKEIDGEGGAAER